MLGLHCQGPAWAVGSLGNRVRGMVRGPLGWQGHPTTPASSRAAGGHRAAPAVGIGHLPGDGSRLGQGVGLWVILPWGPVARQDMAVGRWRPALLRHFWGRGWQPWGLRWGPGPQAGLGQPQGTGEGQSGLTVPSGPDVHLATTNMAYPAPLLDLSWRGFKRQNCEWEG